MTSGSVLNSFTALSLTFSGIDPSNLLNSIWLLFSERSSKSNMPVHWVKTMALAGVLSLGTDPMVSSASSVLMMIEFSMSMVFRIFEEMQLLSQTENGRCTSMGWLVGASDSRLGQRQNFNTSVNKRFSALISLPQCGAGQTFSIIFPFSNIFKCTHSEQKTWADGGATVSFGGSYKTVGKWKIIKVVG